MKRVIVATCGKSGTTFLMKLLIACGFKGHPTECHNEIWRDWEKFPELVKSALFSIMPLSWWKRNRDDIRHVFLTLRDPLQQWASHAELDKEPFQVTHYPHPIVPAEGVGPPHLRGPDRIISSWGQLLHNLVQSDVPYTALAHPRFCLDQEYLWREISHEFPEIAAETFSYHFEKLSDPEKVRTHVPRK